jgi:hypothetical protein
MGLPVYFAQPIHTGQRSYAFPLDKYIDVKFTCTSVRTKQSHVEIEMLSDHQSASVRRKASREGAKLNEWFHVNSYQHPCTMYI